MKHFIITQNTSGRVLEIKEFSTSEASISYKRGFERDHNGSVTYAKALSIDKLVGAYAKYTPDADTEIVLLDDLTGWQIVRMYLLGALGCYTILYSFITVGEMLGWSRHTALLAMLWTMVAFLVGLLIFCECREKLKPYTIKFFWFWHLSGWCLEFEKCTCNCRRIYVGPLEVQLRLTNCDAWED